MTCDQCDAKVSVQPIKGIITLCVECMNDHLAEKARARRVQRPPVGARALGAMLAGGRAAGERSRGAAIHEKG